MTFREVLNDYVETIGCSGKELADASGLSATIISRYRSGERTPRGDSDSLHQLAEALASLSASGDRVFKAGEILTAFRIALGAASQGMLKTDNLNALLEVLDIAPVKLARVLSYDPSVISRIRSGQRMPAKPDDFVGGVCCFVVRKYRGREDRSRLAQLMGCEEEIVSDNAKCLDALKEWLFHGTVEQKDSIGVFLSKLDEFDLNEYIEAIHFNDIKVPTLPFHLPTSKNYYGVEQMKAGELDFFKATALSHSKERVFMCSDMPMDDMAEDKEWAKKWMFGLAAMIRKRLNLDMVHNLNRPFSELMLGLESWIPLYMTGQVTPWYLPGTHNSVFCHMTYVSGAAALSGECIADCHDSGKYYLSKYREDIAYYRRRSEDILKRAKPLMKIYKADGESRLKAALSADAATPGRRHGMLSVPPLYTISDALLSRILDRNGISEKSREAILTCAAEQRSRVERILAENTIFDELHRMTEEEFAAHPAKLSMVGAFWEEDIAYTWEEYAEHLRLLEAFADSHKNYTADLPMSCAFRNIQITIHEGKWAMVSKNNAPAIHFVIQHPKLRGAIENMVMPYVE